MTGWHAGMNEASTANHRRRSWLKVQVTDDPNSCWTWTGPLNVDGYAKTDTNMSHRKVYAMVRGPIPAGLTIDHLCRNRACLNPWHMEPVTMRVNNLRGSSPSALNARKTACKHGHPFDQANTYTCRGSRLCRVCNLEAVKRYKARAI